MAVGANVAIGRTTFSTRVRVDGFHRQLTDRGCLISAGQGRRLEHGGAAIMPMKRVVPGTYAQDT